MSNLLYVEEMEWGGEIYVVELIKGLDFADLPRATQVQAVCFCDDQLVIYKDIDGDYGLPGGTVEAGEDYEQTLRRELREEAAVSVRDFQPLLALRTYKKDEPENISWQLRYIAEVELLDQPVDDPDGKAIARAVVGKREALEKVGWGRKLEIFIAEALKLR